jgi:hypothetical protein
MLRERDMGLFKGMKQSKERQKAKAFYESAANLPADSRETRKLRSVLGNRTTAFIDMTFIDGAKRTEAYAEALAAAKTHGGEPPAKPVAPCFREVKTVGGAVWVYLPQSYCDQFFILGSKYQQSIITPAAVIEISETLTKEIAEALLLDHPLTPLQFLTGDSDESPPQDAEDAE